MFPRRHFRHKAEGDREMSPIHRAVSSGMLLKAMGGFAIAAIALTSVALPKFGIFPGTVAQLGIAACGSIIGILIALRA
jgi:hypothetical protein